MKINFKQYAQALYDLSRDAEKENVEKIISGFVNILLANNDVSKLDKIIDEYNKLWNSEHGIADAEIISARGMDANIIKLLKIHIAKLSGAKSVELREKTDKNILGGVVMKYGDKILDASLRAKVIALKKTMIK